MSPISRAIFPLRSLFITDEYSVITIIIGIIIIIIIIIAIALNILFYIDI